MIKKIVRNPSVVYLLTRYITYAIQFFNSIFIAVLLGPSYLAVWGVILLVLQYFAQINFGIPHSLNAIMSVNKAHSNYLKIVFNNSLILVSALCVVVLFLSASIFFFDVNLWDKYNFSEYLPEVVLVALLTYFNQIFSNLFRVFNRLFEVAVNQSLFPITMLFCLFVWKGDSLITYLLYANILSCSLSLLLFVVRCPINLNFQFNVSIIREILLRGFFLFLYNSSFYLIMMSSRSIISAFFSPVEFGYFTFAFTVASAIMLMLEAINFLVYPKILNKFGNSSREESSKTINSIREIYIVSSYSLIFIAIFLFPAFVNFFPQYADSIQTFRLISLTLALYTSCFGYSSLLISKGKERILGLFAFLTLLINVGLSLLLITVFNTSFSTAILSTSLAYLIYLVILNYHGQKELNPEITFYDSLKFGFPYSIFIPYSLFFIMAIFSFITYLYLIPLFLFLVLNMKSIYRIIKTGMSLLTNPNFFKF